MESPIPKRLKEARLSAKLSQKKLGIAAGVDEFSASARLNHYEMGRHTPDYHTLKRIADVLLIPPSYFYAEEDELAEIIKLFFALNSGKKLEVLRFIETISNKK
ncbi:helix-turn-helix domain-containing protein [Legionella maceachernii]|uniref:HTH-type transcriptional regulator Xre n=1 Tax=Legionella maceachernii TaxID=466 RepID=A0A0W0WBJ0_9GAMM|nr:helix-turn-helix transcriptional regulator [Legionella maceachernii]KTD29682.1 HTH-type transcriptional regulator Xre [Legionella maceachernii]SKA21079.1 Helix-turn-helix domain-containing protein [Legionella maceachernii]SUP02582.1 Helix-turn-helix domain [Legionella maceachernii]